MTFVIITSDLKRVARDYRNLFKDSNVRAEKMVSLVILMPYVMNWSKL